jgi:hypothetical protein
LLWQKLCPKGKEDAMTLSPVAVQAWHRLLRWLALTLLGVALIALSPLQALAQNTPPVIQVNAGLTLSEGSTSTIGPSLLLVTDAEQGASELTFTVVAGPTNGSLSLATGFTQADIDNYSVTYIHNGGETTVDYFTFIVSDGAGGTISTTSVTVPVAPYQRLRLSSRLRRKMTPRLWRSTTVFR